MPQYVESPICFYFHLVIFNRQYLYILLDDLVEGQTTHRIQSREEVDRFDAEFMELGNTHDSPEGDSSSDEETTEGAASSQPDNIDPDNVSAGNLCWADLSLTYFVCDLMV